MVLILHQTQFTKSIMRCIDFCLTASKVRFEVASCFQGVVAKFM